MTHEPGKTFLDRWSTLYSVPRSELIAARIVLGVMLVAGIVLSFTDLGVRVGVSIWLALATYVVVLVVLLRRLVRVDNRATPWPFWPYFTAAAVAGLVATLVTQGALLRPLFAVAISSGLVYGGSHWLLVRLLQRADRS